MISFLWYLKLLLHSEFAPRIGIFLYFYFDLLTLLEMCSHSDYAEDGDHFEPSNYRPVALTLSLFKVFKNIFLNKKIWKHLNSYNLASNCRYDLCKEALLVFFLFFLTISPLLFRISENLSYIYTSGIRYENFLLLFPQFSIT